MKRTIEHSSITPDLTLFLQNLYHHWINQSGTQPNRILIFRNGGNDGQFECKFYFHLALTPHYFAFLIFHIRHGTAIVEAEVTAVKMEIARLFQSSEPAAGNESLLRPSVTFVVAQSNHNLVIAPDETWHQQNNVPGGTSLRQRNILPRTHYLEKINDGDEDTVNGMDFFLTAHQGLKGTSKPLLYRCLVNDDSNKGPLDRDTLRQVTYVRVTAVD